MTPLSCSSVNSRLHGSAATTTPQTQDSQTTQLTQSPDVSAVCETASESLLWVDKYKPTNIRQIIGQQGDRSNAKKLLTWLQNWHANLGRKPACRYIEHEYLHNRSPPYLKDLVTFSVSGPQRRQLRSTTTRSAVVL